MRLPDCVAVIVPSLYSTDGSHIRRSCRKCTRSTSTSFRLRFRRDSSGQKTAAVSDQPCIVAATTDPVLTRPMFQLLLRPASASVVHELDATMFVAKLPSENS